MYLRLLRSNRDFRLLYTGTLISLGGDWFLTVALLDLVLQLTGSATLASLMLLCQSLPIFIFTPLAGHVIDRIDRRKLMIAMDVIRTGACLLPLLARSPALLPFAYARAHPRVLALLASKGGYGLGAGVVALLSVFGKEVFKAGAFGIGMLFAARGVGALIGPFAVRALSDRDETQYKLIAASVLL